MLHSQESYVALIFMAVVGVIYILALRFLIGACWGRWVSHKPKPLRRWVRRLRNGSWTLAIIGLLCLAWAFFEPYWPEVTHLTIRSDKLTGLQRPIRMVLISDLHCDAKPRAEETVLELIKPLKPDLIVITGDYINSPAGEENAHKTLSDLAKIAPTYIVLGNWDPHFLPDIKPWENTGVIPIGGRVENISLAGTHFLLGGADFANPYQLEEVLNTFRQKPEAFSILLYHHPNQIRTVAASGAVDLMLLGHTHGGQVCLPFYGAMVTLSGEGKRWEAGEYQLDGMTVYINRGIGMEGGLAPRIRFLARPEITLIELKQADQKTTSGASEK